MTATADQLRHHIASLRERLHRTEATRIFAAVEDLRDPDFPCRLFGYDVPMVKGERATGCSFYGVPVVASSFVPAGRVVLSGADGSVRVLLLGEATVPD